MSDNRTTALQPVPSGDVQLAGPSDYDGLVMAVSPAEALKRVQELQAFVAAVMVRGVDYGTIPGTGNRPTLLQPGAQKLCEIYGFAVTFEDAGSTLDWKQPLFFFRKRCVLTSRRDGHFVCDGVGSCNSREDRYAWRWVGERDVPKGMDRATLRTRTRQGKGTSSWTQYRLPNEDVFSLVNTMEKIACKRALMHATTNATRSSGIFTQDVEDLPREAFGQADGQRSWERGEEEGSEPPPAGEKPTPSAAPKSDAKAPRQDGARLWAMRQRCLGDYSERWIGIVQAESPEWAVDLAPGIWPTWHRPAEWCWEAHDYSRLGEKDRDQLHLGMVDLGLKAISATRALDEHAALGLTFRTMPECVRDQLREPWAAHGRKIKASELPDPEPERKGPPTGPQYHVDQETGEVHDEEGKVWDEAMQAFIDPQS